MKIRRYLFILLPIITLLSCAKDIPAPQVLKTSEHNLHFSGNGGSWLLTVNSNTVWMVNGDTEWCSVDKTDGINTDNLIVSVLANDTKQTRTTTLRLISERHEVSVSVEQDTFSGEHHYELPVVFHILYSDENDTIQNARDEVFVNMIEKCNQLYRNNINSIDMNMELVPATHDPDGNVLPVPGIFRLQRTNSAYFDANKFLNESNQADAELLWDPNKYVNVFVFTFTQRNLLGLSPLPYTPRENSLPGLYANNTYYTSIPNFPYGITINNTYINEENIYKTLAHELGHYLGLHHVFAEKDCETETDYCDDTYSYNRESYDNNLAENGAGMTEQQKYQRTSCEGIEFTSFNIMDYDYSYMNQFTADQFLRIRHVLENSPLIPGPKNIIVTKGRMIETEIPPVIVME